MKILLTYSSKTGNTKKVAEAIYEIMPEGTELYSVETAPNPSDYEIVIVGFWIDKGRPDKKAIDYINTIESKKVGIFGTLGAYPDSEHAKKSMVNAKDLLEPRNEVIGEFICQGKVDPALSDRFKDLPKDHPHALTPERIARHKEAAKHPNEEDFIKAKEVFKEMLLKLNAK